MVFQKGHIPHNKGKTKENYEPLKQVSQKMIDNRNWNNPNSKKSWFKKGQSPPNKIELPKDLLIYWYETKKLGLKKIGKKFGVYGGCVKRNLEIYGIRVRNCSEAQSISPIWKGKKRPELSKRMQGKNNPNYGNHKLKGHKLTPEQCEKISLAKLGKKRPDMMGDKNPHYGIPAWNKDKTKKDDPRLLSMSKKHSQIMHKKLALGKMPKSINTNIEKIMKKELIKRGYIVTNYEKYQKTENKTNLIVHQCPIFGSKGNIKFTTDFGFPDRKVFIECDGEIYHKKEHMIRLLGSKIFPDMKSINRKLQQDNARNSYTKKCGYILLRFWGKKIENNVQNCVDEIEKELKKNKKLKNI